MTQIGAPIVSVDQRSVVEIGSDANHYLVGSKCCNCSKVSFLEREVCPACLSYAGHEKKLIGRVGKINNFTVAHVAPEGYKVPYIVGFIDLEEGPRIFATIEGDLATGARLCIGDEVRLVVEEVVGPSCDTKLKWKYVPTEK